MILVTSLQNIAIIVLFYDVISLHVLLCLIHLASLYKKEHVIYVGFTPICSLKHSLRVLEYVPSDKEDSYVFNYDLLHT